MSSVHKTDRLWVLSRLKFEQLPHGRVLWAAGHLWSQPHLPYWITVCRGCCQRWKWKSRHLAEGCPLKWFMSKVGEGWTCFKINSIFHFVTTLTPLGSAAAAEVCVKSCTEACEHIWVLRSHPIFSSRGGSVVPPGGGHGHPDLFDARGPPLPQFE